MTPRERFLSVLRFQRPDDRMPMVEWAAWWDQTIARWRTEGLSAELDWQGSLDHFGLDTLICIPIVATSARCPHPAHHGAGIIANEADYDALLPALYTDEAIASAIAAARELRARHDAGDVIIRLWLDGFFWFPRILLGIERHLYAFYEQPELMHRINADLAAYNIRAVEALFPELRPDMVGFAEDMSYNLGPMLSHDLFREYLQPYYREVIPHIRAYDVKVLIDSDGDITTMVPWMQDAGIEGVYPLERQAHVDVNALRRDYPELLMMGGYDKMVMPHGEAAMRAEFDRILPAMRSGGYIPSVDHQTPPGVSLENYRVYIRLFREYAERAVQG